MAKKKVSTNVHNSHQHDPPHPPHHHSSTMDDPSDQLDKLKNLNALLIKETADRRLQVDSLTHDKEALESAFNRSAMEKRDLELQLSDAADDNVTVHLHESVVLVYLHAQVSEMRFHFHALVAQRNRIESDKSERDAEIARLGGELSRLSVCLESERDKLSRLSRERDVLKVDFDGVVDEANRLKERVDEAEKTENKLRDDIDRLRKEGDKLREENNEKEGAIRKLTSERDLALKKAAESAKLIDELNGEVSEINRAKSEIEEQKHAQEGKIKKLESELKKINKSLKESRVEEAVMRGKIVEYEKSLELAMEDLKSMKMEMADFQKGINENEKTIDMITVHRDSLQKVLDMTRKEVNEKQGVIDGLIREKNKAQQAKADLQNDIFDLNKDMDRLKDALRKVEESRRGLEKKSDLLLSEVEHYRNTADEAFKERDSIKKGFEEEKDRVKSLILEVAEMKDRMEKTEAELGVMRSDREKLVQKNEVLEDRVNTLTKEKDVLMESFVDAERNCDDLRARIECSSQALTLLKKTAALVCHSKNGESVEEVALIGERLDEEFVPYAEDLDAIKKAFKNKDKVVEDMKLQLVSLENFAAEAQKRKGFWALISSVTTIFAAVLAAYAVRAR